MRLSLLFLLAIALVISSCELKNDVIDVLPSDSTVAIVVTAPSSGVEIMDGASYNINWTATNVKYVNIYLSTNNGTTWLPIADSVKNTGMYLWGPVPNYYSVQCKIRVSNPDGTVSNSSKTFSIIPNTSKSIKILSPKGGELWEAGSAQEIKWFSTGINDVKIDYTTNNGLNWTPVDSLTIKNTGRYDWEPIPAALSNLAKIRISNADAVSIGNPTVMSDSTFSIVPESKIQIISPNGSETLYYNGTRKIEWVSENIANVKISFSTNNGANWNVIENSWPSVGFYNWNTIPDINSQNCKIRIADAADGEPWDVSDIVFTITNLIVKTIEVTSPNGGEKWQAGTAQNITWNSSGVPTVKIDYTTNNGIDWIKLVEQLPNTGAYEWNVPNSLSTQCLIKVLSYPDSLIIDQSNAKFNIVPKPELKVISPNGGETWAAGQVDTIRWTSIGIANVSIEYSTDNGNVWGELVKSTESDGEYETSFTVPSNKYKIRIFDADNFSPVDESNGTFTVTEEPSITVQTPNGGEEWFAGSQDNIRWSSANIETVNILYTSNNGATWNPIATGIQSNGYYSWNIPSIFSTLCRIKVENNNNEGNPADVSDNNFTINNVKLIKVKSPNGDEQLEAGSTQSITWDATGIDNVKIEYTIDNNHWLTLVPSTQSTGYYNWAQVPNTPSTNCKVRISNADGTGPSDDSDAFFSIIPTIPVSTIKVLAPNGGETYQSGSTQEIKWQSENIPNVKIEFTTNGGASWESISTVASTGSFSWTVLDGNSKQCRIRISDATDGIPLDISDANFEITNLVTPSITITSPNGAENWTAGSKHNITWNGIHISTVKIEFSTDQGSNWSDVPGGSSISGGAFEWELDNNLNSKQCLVRVSTVVDGVIYSDVSDAVFTVKPLPWIIVNDPQPRTYKTTEPVTITWQSGGIENVGIKYTTTNGVADISNPAFIDLAIVGAAVGQYTTYFGKPSDKYFVVVYNADEGANKLPSNNSPSFAIEKGSTDSVNVISPNGGEEWLASGTDQFEIKWHGFGMSFVKVQFSLDGGKTYSNVNGLDSVANTGTLTWILPAGITTNSDNCIIKVSNTNLTVYDISDNVFSIHFSKLIRVTSQNAVEYYYPPDDLLNPTAGKNWPMLITWNTYAVTQVDLFYSLDNGTTWQTLATNIPNTGAFGWDFVFGNNGPAESSISSQLRIKVQEAGNPSVSDVNDVPVYLNIKGS